MIQFNHNDSFINIDLLPPTSGFNFTFRVYFCHNLSSRTTPSAPPEGAFPWILTLIRTQFPIIPHTWAWLPCHTCTSSTHTHISSTLPCTHCKVLICPGCHFWALLPVFVFLLLPLPWSSTLWFLSGCPDSDCFPGLWY